jgi:stage II sporulation protein D
MSRGLHVSALAAALALGACTPPRTPAPPGASLPDRVRVRTAGRIVALPIDDYVLGTVLAELAPAGEPPEVIARLFEVQAVVARSYAAARRGRHGKEGFDLCDTTHCQLYAPSRLRTSRFADAARSAVARTRGQVLVYRGRNVEAVYHADCGGSTSDASTVWGGTVPYLRAREDDVAAHGSRPWTTTLESDELRRALNADPRTAVGRRLDQIRPGPMDSGSRPRDVTLAGERIRIVRGEELRSALTRAFGMRAMPSTRFTIRRDGSRWVFEGSGLGHGVGLCQAGARARARSGDNIMEILQAYFSGAALAPLRDN